MTEDDLAFELGSVIRPLSSDECARRDWQVSIDGVTMPEVRSVEIAAEQFGALRYGMTRGGYDSWSFSESNGGGGAVVIPYSRIDGRVYIGLVRELRSNLGGETLNVPRGFVDSGEDHGAAARRELLEETGLATNAVTLLDGAPVNCNSAFFNTASAHSGVRFFAVEIAPDWLEVRDGTVKFRDDAISKDSAVLAKQRKERIKGTEFVEWSEAVQLRDMFTLAAIARLLAMLTRNKPLML